MDPTKPLDIFHIKKKILEFQNAGQFKTQSQTSPVLPHPLTSAKDEAISVPGRLRHTWNNPGNIYIGIPQGAAPKKAGGRHCTVHMLLVA